MFVAVILISLIIALLTHLATRKHLPKNVPKGPLRIPFLGCLEYVMYHSDMKRLRDKYGDVFLTKVGNQYMVYLCNYELVKEAFSSPNATDRPQFEVAYFITDGKPAGITFTNGEQWTSLRKFLLRQLGDLGMGKSHMEDAILSEAKKLSKEFEKLVGKPSYLPKCIDISVLNIVWRLVADKHYAYDDERILELIGLLHETVEDIGYFCVKDLFPILKCLPKFLRDYFLKEYLVDGFKKKMIDITKGEIEEHKANLDAENPKDVIDHYLIEMDEQKNNPDKPQFKSDMDLTTTLFNLFAAGSETTAATLQWFILYVAAHPRVQRKLQDELDAVLDYDEEISLDHKDSLPYLEATIHETHRHASFASFGVPHQTSRETQIGGYTIPKGAHVTACVSLCHEDSKYWKEPQHFQPERFIDETGKFKPQKESFMPFGIGRRQCLGEALACMELYFFSAVLIQNFNFAPQKGCILDIKPAHMPLGHYSKEQKFSITPRHMKLEQRRTHGCVLGGAVTSRCLV